MKNISSLKNSMLIIMSILFAASCSTAPPIPEIDFGEYLVEEYTPSPDWKEQIIYFLVTDRFADGDPTNNDLGHGEYQPEDVEFYHGGDLKGLTERLDYIKATGSTAIWLTPQVANQWLSPAYGRRGTRYSGYHGYWARDFYAVDEHLGSLNDYRVFVREAHDRGLYVIQDIVPNHMGDFFDEEGNLNDPPGIPARPDAPFDDPERHREFFHFGGTDIYTQGFANLLDDMNTEDPFVIQSLIDIFKWWITETDIDGYRIDTVKYIPMAFWQEFIPAIREHAASLGKEDFIIFGEAYDYENIIIENFVGSDTNTAQYTGTNEAPLFNSMLDFSVSGAIHEVFLGKTVTGQGDGIPDPFTYISDRFAQEAMTKYTEESAWQRVNFIDNHDMARFLNNMKADGDEDLLKLALTTLYTIPGIPKIYYGTEQGFDQPPAIKNGKPGFDNRQDLWDSGYQTGGDLFRFIAQLSTIRLENPALTHGDFQQLHGAEGDLWIFSRSTDDQTILVLINRSEDSMAPEGMDTNGKYVDLLSGRELSGDFRIPGKTAFILLPNQ